MTRNLLGAASVLGAMCLLCSTQASSQSVEAFYKSRPLTLLSASGAGGGYDVYARVMARHLPKHLAGHPNILVKNMEGAGGLKATNYLANVAERDGSVILATYNTLSLQPLIDSTGIQYDPRELNWIGSIGKQQNICTTWKTHSDVKTLEDAMKREVIVASTGPSNNNSTVPIVLNSLVKTKFKIIYGYTTGSMRLAMESGEVEGICGLAYSTLMASDPAWILEKKVNILAQFAKVKMAALPDVPLASEFINDPKDQMVYDVLTIPQEMGRPIVAPQRVAVERIAALRTAFNDTMKDPDFLSDAKRSQLIVEPLTGEEMSGYIREIYATPPEVLKRAADLIRISN
jgi:tripartite-type tricarboxylate transporter receptor subunit TctC